MQRAAIDRLKEFVDKAAKITNSLDAEQWGLQVGAFLGTALGADHTDRFFALGTRGDAMEHLL
ncbi:hypothetical protein FBQ96_04595 [Nitrospirales bacterium NOB]|nr:hypothetical protein [Nitrospirota bacterium]MCE7966773.1 hypothetical protein [Nitrospira sp. NTP2]MCK6494029.1 hypothetical protein [Nitrospira sp.]MDL1888854.1 hypothetical protein [Nitrospirales bacterium NOB]MEB2339954.1 hypothetical protein [Nitrospirales bacterium]